MEPTPGTLLVASPELLDPNFADAVVLVLDSDESGALAVAVLADPEDEPVGWRATYGAVGLIDLDSPVELIDGSVRVMRVFAGYAGWGAEQLIEEIAEGSWYVVASELDDVFRADVEDLRRQVLRRQPGELAWVSTRPADPMMN